MVLLLIGASIMTAPFACRVVGERSVTAGLNPYQA
jgi:hypothetical protein